MQGATEDDLIADIDTRNQTKIVSDTIRPAMLRISSRQDYIDKWLTESAGKSRKRWRTANELLHNKDREYSPDIPDSQKLCSNLSDYFVNKLLTIRQTIRDQLTLINLNIST